MPQRRKGYSDSNSTSNRFENAKKTGLTRRSALNNLAFMGSTGLIAVSGLPLRLLGSTGFENSNACNLDLAQWRALIGQEFSICESKYAESRNVIGTKFTLEEVIENSNRNTVSFSLLFSSDRDIQSATYGFNNETIGCRVFFVHPIERDNRKRQEIFEVVLNRIFSYSCSTQIGDTVAN